MKKEHRRESIGILSKMCENDGHDGTALILRLAQFSMDLDDGYEMFKAILPAAVPFINESLRKRGLKTQLSLSDPEWPDHFE